MWEGGSGGGGVREGREAWLCVGEGEFCFRNEWNCGLMPRRSLVLESFLLLFCLLLLLFVFVIVVVVVCCCLCVRLCDFSLVKAVWLRCKCANRISVEELMFRVVIVVAVIVVVLWIE